MATRHTHDPNPPATRPSAYRPTHHHPNPNAAATPTAPTPVANVGPTATPIDPDTWANYTVGARIVVDDPDTARLALGHTNGWPEPHPWGEPLPVGHPGYKDPGPSLTEAYLRWLAYATALTLAVIAVTIVAIAATRPADEPAEPTTVDAGADTFHTTGDGSRYLGPTSDLPTLGHEPVNDLDGEGVGVGR